jgi:hypothetical protein
MCFINLVRTSREKILMIGRVLLTNQRRECYDALLLEKNLHAR